jgi:hypothetical protein
MPTVGEVLKGESFECPECGVNITLEREYNHPDTFDSVTLTHTGCEWEWTFYPKDYDEPINELGGLK